MLACKFNMLTKAKQMRNNMKREGVLCLVDMALFVCASEIMVRQSVACQSSSSSPLLDTTSNFGSLRSAGSER